MAADDVNAKKHWHRFYCPETAVPSRKPQFFPSLLRGRRNGPNLKQNKIPRSNTRFSRSPNPAERSVMSTSDDAPRPLVDQSVLDRLRDELEEEEGYSRVFVGNFIDYLPQRLGRLRLALTTGDLEGSMDAV